MRQRAGQHCRAALRPDPNPRSRSWCLNYRVKDTGQERRPTIGAISSWPVELARTKAAELRRIVDDGGDPLADFEERLAAPTVGELAERYASEEMSKLAPGTQVGYRSLLKRFSMASSTGAIARLSSSDTS